MSGPVMVTSLLSTGARSTHGFELLHCIAFGIKCGFFKRLHVLWKQACSSQRGQPTAAAVLEGLATSLHEIAPD
jgi:hypothetical protein